MARPRATTSPLISVITPSWNAAQWIADCVDSVRRAVTIGRLAVEHIVVDDGSLDNTLEVLHGLAVLPKPSRAGVPYCTPDYRGLRVVEHKHVGMPSLLRNEGARRASGDYLFFLDADDVLIQNSLRYFLEHFSSVPQGRWAYGDFLRCRADLSYTVGFDYYGWPHDSPEALFYSIFKGDHFFQHSFMCQRSLFQEVGGYNPAVRIGEDLDLCVRFVLAGCMPTHVRFNTHFHRDHGSNLTANFDEAAHLQDVLGHFTRHRSRLLGYFTPAQLTEIEDVLGYVPQNGTPVLDRAAALV